MATVPFALSVHSFVNSVGADAGFASIIGLAILVLLYFAHAREAATLRDRLEQADERIGGLEQEIVRLRRAQSQPSAQPQPAQVPARPAAAAAMGSAVAAVRRSAAAATAEAGRTLLLPAAPAGVAAPALAAATRLIPAAPPVAAVERAVAPVAAAGGGSSHQDDLAEDTLYVPPATAAGGANGHSLAPFATPAVTRPPVTPTVAGGGRASGATAVATPPRAQIGADAPPAPPPSRAGGTPNRFVPPPPSRRPTSRRFVPVLFGIGAIAVVVVALLIITGGGSGSPTVVHHPARTSARTKAHSHAVAVNPATVNVVVLNGTAVTNLAHDISLQLAGFGFKEGTPATAANQTHTTTIVGYTLGHEADALAVARALKLRRSSVQPADAEATGVACASANGAQSGASGAAAASSTCSADVIVTVGTDLAGAANTTGASGAAATGVTSG